MKIRYADDNGGWGAGIGAFMVSSRPTAQSHSCIGATQMPREFTVALAGMWSHRETGRECKRTKMIYSRV